MKIFHYLPLTAAALALFSLTSCSDDNDEPKHDTVLNLSAISFNSDDIWAGWDKPGNLVIGDFTFSHQWTEWNTSQGFVAAKISDTSFHTPMYEYQFEVITGGGVDGPGTPYLIANWNSSEFSTPQIEDRCCSIVRTDGANFTPESVYVTNAAYPYYSMLQGDAYASQFGLHDNFILNITGVRPDGTTVDLPVYLANCTTENASEGILNKWMRVDLSQLGTVKGIYFTMSSSDFGVFGMNTPAYFALDKFTVKP